MGSDLNSRSKFDVIRVDGVMPTAADLVWKHRITGADAVHLAAALSARKVLVGDEFYFVASDQRLNAAASAEGLEVLDPTV